MSKRNANGNAGQAIQESCVHLLLLRETEEWVIFVEDVSEHIIHDCLPQQFSSPSALYGEFTKKLQDLLSNAVFRTSLSNKFCAFGLPMEPDLKVLLMVGFVRQFSKEIFELLIKSMRQPEVGSSSSAQQPLTLKKKQIYHYVAGSVVKSLLRKGLLYKAKNLKWRKVVSCIETCFKESGYDVSPAEPETRQWTNLVNRGGLTNVGQQTLEFFYLCGSIAESVKPPSRYSFFQQVFQSTQLAYLWEEIVSGSVLTPEESTWLMELMCRLFYNTFCKGYCNKARNDHLGKGQSSVSTRKRLAR